MAKETKLTKAKQALKAELKQLMINQSKTDKILVSHNYTRIERHLKALKDLVNVADNSKQAVEGLKIAINEDIKNISVWCERVENTTGEVDTDID